MYFFKLLKLRLTLQMSYREFLDFWLLNTGTVLEQQHITQGLLLWCPGQLVQNSESSDSDGNNNGSCIYQIPSLHQA